MKQRTNISLPPPPKRRPNSEATGPTPPKPVTNGNAAFGFIGNAFKFTCAMAGLLAAVVAMIVFVTGKRSLREILPSPSPKIEPAPAPIALQTGVKSVDLESLLAVDITSLRKTALRQELTRQRVKLTGYLVSAQSAGLLGTTAEISVKPDDLSRLYLWLEKSAVEAFSKLEAGTRIEVETSLWAPLAGDIVGRETRLLKVYPPEHADSTISERPAD